MKTKVILAILICQSLVSGCLVEQLNNMNWAKKVCPMPFPALKSLCKCDDEFGFLVGNSKTDERVEDSNASDIILGVLLSPIAVVCIAPSLASDVIFSPYNIPAYLCCKGKKGRFALEEEGTGYAVFWQGWHAGKVENTVVVCIEQGSVSLIGKGAVNPYADLKEPIGPIVHTTFDKRIVSSCNLRFVSPGVNSNMLLSSPWYWVYYDGNAIRFTYEEKVHLVLSDDFRGSVYFADDLKRNDSETIRE